MGESHQTLRYWYFAVGIFSALLMEYEVHFYSSGAMEEDWTEKDLPENFMVASFGSISAALLTVALLAIGALVFLPQRVFPEQLSTAVSGIATPFGRTGYLLVLLGTLACLSGAAVETMLSGLGELRLCAIVIDGTPFKGRHMIVALGIGFDGRKTVLGLRFETALQ